MSGDEVKWEPPGPGSWSVDRVHFDHPTSGFIRLAHMSFAADARDAGFLRSGIAMGRPASGYVNGWPYGGGTPVVDPEQFPELERNATDMLEGKRWRELAKQWHEVDRPAIYGACVEFQDRDPSGMTDLELTQHVHDAIQLLGRAQTHHFEQVGLYFVVGELILTCTRAGVPLADAVALLEGASPATAAASHHLRRIASAVAEAGVEPTSLDAVRAASTEARDGLDEYLAQFGWRVVTGFDVDCAALIELPEVVLTSIRAAGSEQQRQGTGDPEAVRARLPEEERAGFDELLADAREIYALRDDDVGPVMWARGLLRRALLETGRRLAARGAVRDASDVFEAGPDELSALLDGGAAPTAEDLAARAALRREQAKLDPPRRLGDRPPPPPTDLPPNVARVTAAMAAYSAQARPREGERLRGLGIGTKPYRGRARVVERAEDAIAALEPGDVLVTAMTTPAFNGVMGIAGAVAVQEGGLMTHAAIMARELGLPAVVGVAGLLEDVHDGDVIEIDPAAGEVRLVESAGS